MSFKLSIATGSLLKLTDTQDCGPGLQALAGVVRLDQLWALCMIYRYFSHELTWAALVERGGHWQLGQADRNSRLSTWLWQPAS